MDERRFFPLRKLLHKPLVTVVLGTDARPDLVQGHQGHENHLRRGIEGRETGFGDPLKGLQSPFARETGVMAKERDGHVENADSAGVWAGDQV